MPAILFVRKPFKWVYDYPQHGFPITVIRLDDY